MQSVIFQATKSFLNFELNALSSIHYSDKLYIQNGGSYKTKRMNKNKIEEFRSFIAEFYPEAFEGLRKSVSEESPWDEDMYITIQFNLMDDGFYIYMD